VFSKSTTDVNAEADVFTLTHRRCLWLIPCVTRWANMVYDPARLKASVCPRTSGTQKHTHYMLLERLATVTCTGCTCCSYLARPSPVGQKQAQQAGLLAW
jgi:hypothetical protein